MNDKKRKLTQEDVRRKVVSDIIAEVREVSNVSSVELENMYAYGKRNYIGTEFMRRELGE